MPYGPPSPADCMHVTGAWQAAAMYFHDDRRLEQAAAWPVRLSIATCSPARMSMPSFKVAIVA